jgi:hypothetical protein
MEFDAEGRVMAALEIQKALRRPAGQLCKTAPARKTTRTDRRDQLRRQAARVVEEMAKAGIKSASPLLESLSGGAFNGVGADATAAIRKTHDAGPQIEDGDTMSKLKTSLPAQSRNGTNSNEMADTGSGAFARQPVPSQKPTMFGPTHAASISDGKPPPEDATLGALKAIFKAGPKRML